MTTKKLKIEGMSCGHCVAAVQRALGSVEGVDVERVEIGEATLGVSDEQQLERAIAALQDEGYEASLAAGGA